MGALDFRRFWNPAARVEVAGVRWDALVPEAVTIEWRITRTNTPTPDEGEIAVYNPRPDRARAVEELYLETLTARVAPLCEVSIGWDGSVGRVMRGDILRVEYGPTGVDTMIRIGLGDGLRARERSTVGLQVGGDTLAGALRLLITTPPNADGQGIGGLGLVLPPESLALLDASTSGKVPFRGIPAGQPTGRTVDSLLASLGLTGVARDGQFWILRGGLINDRPGPILRPSTGLAEWRPRDDGGAEIEALADPRVVPGIQVFAQDEQGRSLGAQVYRVERVEFTGSTMTGESMMAIQAAPGVTL